MQGKAIVGLISGIFCFSLLAANYAGLERSQADIVRDKTSKPHEIIKFSGVKPGDKVLDLFGGGGYYTELLAAEVGEKGHVVIHNNAAYMPLIGKELSKRLANNRLPNVTSLLSESESLQLGKLQFDVVFFILGYHDFYISTSNWKVDADQVMSQLYSALKPGGKLLVIDHSAKLGNGVKDAQKLHRIEAAFVRDDVKSRGFKLLNHSDLLKNPQDPLDNSVFLPEIRRQTDRFVMLFEKI